jgi:F0F1-type ATP synthase epsilon subunit
MSTEKVLKLSIISSLKSDHLDVAWIEIESPSGSFTVTPQHAPLVSIVKNNSIFSYQTSSGEIFNQQVTGGLFHVAQNRAAIILSS